MKGDIMKFYFFIISASLAISLWYQAHASSLSFLSKDYFMQSIVPQEEHEAFGHFYKNFMTPIDTMKPEHKAKTIQEVREFARNHLEIKHPLWFKELKPFNYFERSNTKTFSAQERAQVRSFLTRYGIYEKFLESKAKPTIWNNIKSYAKNIGSYAKNIGNQLAHVTNSIKRTFWA